MPHPPLQIGVCQPNVHCRRGRGAHRTQSAGSNHSRRGRRSQSWSSRPMCTSLIGEPSEPSAAPSDSPTCHVGRAASAASWKVNLAQPRHSAPELSPCPNCPNHPAFSHCARSTHALACGSDGPPPRVAAGALRWWWLVRASAAAPRAALLHGSGALAHTPLLSPARPPQAHPAVAAALSPIRSLPCEARRW